MPPIPAHIRRQRLVTFSALIAAAAMLILLAAADIAGLWP
jgi:hypothetical protein